jgi:YHS domain-containing protein
MKRLIVAGLFTLALLLPTRAADEDNPAKEALQALNDYVGQWKGAGANTSKSENWSEKMSWGWKFKGDDAWLTVEFKDGKDFDKGELRYDADKKKYKLTVKDKKGDEKNFVGELKKGYLTLDYTDPKSGETQRLMMNTAAGGIRFVYNLQRKPKGSTLFTKLYQVESGKEGESLAGNSGKERECVVTGGRGTIEVSYKGKTYYVCCSGCRDAFNENPEKILKEYAERKKKEK